MKKIIAILFFLASFGFAYAAPQKVRLEGLDQHRFGDLYAELLGVKGDVPSVAQVDFNKNLKLLWERKLERKHGVTDAAEKVASEAQAYYRQKQTRMPLSSYILWVDRDILGLKKSIDWDGVCGVRLQGAKCDLLKKVAFKLDGKDLVAYGMTELLPSANGRLNIKFTDVILRNAGREYLEVIPAVYDKYASLGFWQFTSFAVYNARKEVRGASSVNLYVAQNYKIPGSVVKLRAEDHHRAAYLFAVYNLRALIQQMSAKEVANLAKGHKKNFDELVQFVATAHHLPAHAINGARRWAANNMKLPLKNSLGAKLRKYATKTENNLEALQVAF